MTSGGLREALVRALLYVGTARSGADERGFEAIRRIRRAHPEARQLTLAEFKALIREQYLMLLIDEEAALAAIPGCCPNAIDDRRAAFATLREVLERQRRAHRRRRRAARRAWRRSSASTPSR